MKKKPTFEGYRSPDGTRHDRIEQYRQFVREHVSELSQSDIACAISDAEGPMGLAWDRLVEMVDLALGDSVIKGNKNCVEFLEIMRSIAASVDAYDTVDAALSNALKPMFAKQMAFDNKAVSQGRYDEAKYWMKDQLKNDSNSSEKSKNQIAKDYVFKIKEKFGYEVSADTIARKWL